MPPLNLWIGSPFDINTINDLRGLVLTSAQKSWLGRLIAERRATPQELAAITQLPSHTLSRWGRTVASGATVRDSGGRPPSVTETELDRLATVLVDQGVAVEQLSLPQLSELIQTLQRSRAPAPLVEIDASRRTSKRLRHLPPTT